MPPNASPLILVLDPSQFTCRLLGKKLETFSCQVITETKAKQALIIAKKTKPMLILLELNFSNPSGFEICELLSRTPELSATPIVIHSNRSTRRDVLTSLKSGAVNFIVKPASTETIVRKINEVVVKAGGEELFTITVQEGQAAAGGAKVNITSKKGGAGEADPKKGKDGIVFTPEMDTTTRIDTLLKNAKEVKAMPFGVARTLQVTQDDKSGASDLGKVIESDTAISAMVLKRANSAHYGRQDPIVQVKDAIVRIGFGETRNLVLSISVVKNFGKSTNSLGFQRGDFWEHSIAVASLAKHIAKNHGKIDPDLAFVGGLIHDIGKLIFDEYMSNDYELALEASGKKGIPISKAEREVFGINHTEVGDSLLNRWKFPKELSRVALYHNSYKELDINLEPEYRPMVKLLYMANALAKAYRLGNSGDEIIYPLPDELMLELKMPTGLPPGVSDAAEAQIRDYKDFLQIPPGDDPEEPRREFVDKRIIFCQEPAPIIDLHEIYLSRKWGFKLERVPNLETLEKVEGLSEAIILIQAKNDHEDRGRLQKLFSLHNRGTVLVLLEPVSTGAEDAPTWPGEKVFTLTKPIDGRKLITKLSQICQELILSNLDLPS